MNNQKINKVFNRSGLASLSDLQSEAWQKIFSVLEGQQAVFLSKANEFRSEEYKWPRDPLHCWSRPWEYPYVYYHINQYVKSLAGGSLPFVADVGSGVTFFPFSIAQLGCEVICTDIDPVCANDISRARESISCLPGSIDFKLINNGVLPFEDNQCDIVYCISVLEHIHDFENTVKEIVRVLKHGGLCIITCDIGLDLKSCYELSIKQYKKLLPMIQEYFSFLHPERTIHPLDALNEKNSPFSDRPISYLKVGNQLIKQKVLKPLLGRKPGSVKMPKEASFNILGLVLKKM